jgi:hypothetical protein
VSFVLLNALVSIGIFCLVLLFVRIGRRNGARRLAADPTVGRSGLGVIESVVYALLGLVLAFSFNGAGERFLARRAQIGHELNAIGTAYLRIDLLPPEAQPEIRARFRRYLELRRQAVRAIPDIARVRMHLTQSSDVLQEIWKLTMVATKNGSTAPTSQIFLPALNDMIDAQTDAQVAMLQHPPFVIEFVLIGLMLLAALFTGEAIAESKRPSRLHILGMSALLAVMSFIINDLERPMAGLIRVNDTQWMVDDLERMMAP